MNIQEWNEEVGRYFADHKYFFRGKYAADNQYSDFDIVSKDGIYYYYLVGIFFKIPIGISIESTMLGTTIDSLIVEKHSDEKQINEDIIRIIKRYSDKWNGAKIEIEVNSNYVTFYDCTTNQTVYSYKVETNIKL